MEINQCSQKKLEGRISVGADVGIGPYGTAPASAKKRDARACAPQGM